LSERQDERLCFVGNGYIVIGANEDMKAKFLLDVSYLSAESRWINMKSLRGFPKVQLARNCENVFELSEWGSTGHEFTIRMKSPY